MSTVRDVRGGSVGPLRLRLLLEVLRRGSIAAGAAALALAGCGGTADAARTVPSTRGVCGTHAASRVKVRHVVWIVLENQAFASVIGARSAPYLTRLAASCGLATRFSAEAHPSLPNYVAMTSGSTQAISDDDGTRAHRLTAPSIFEQLGTRWRALEESMPHPCTLADAGRYAVRHNPAAYYVRIRRQCRTQDVPLRGAPAPSARFTFVTPNLCHDMHSCSVATGDRWLARWLPRLLRTPQYRSGSTAVFITWDEDNGSARQHIPTLVVSADTRPRTRSAAAFDHYSLLATTEDLLGVPRLGRAAGAASMAGAFGLR
jgi:phosphatidylinositol-3-phosphatase